MPRLFLTGCVLFLLIFSPLARWLPAEERGVFDYEKQRLAGDKIKKIIFIADAGTHGGRGNHEFMAGSILMARTLNTAYPEVHAVVHSTRNWPEDVSHADAIIVLLNHAKKLPRSPVSMLPCARERVSWRSISE